MAFDFESLPLEKTESNFENLLDSLPLEEAPTEDAPSPVLSIGSKPPGTEDINVDPGRTSLTTDGEFGTLGDIGFPLAGTVIGGAIGGPVGAFVGGPAGQAVKEGVEAFLGAEKTIFPSTVKSFIKDDSVIGNIAKEGLFQLAGGALGKVGSKAIKLFKPKDFVKMKNAVNAGVQKKGTSAFSKVGDYLEGIISDVPKSAKDRVILDFQLAGEKSGIKPLVTKRVLERGPKSILNEKNLSSFEIDPDTAKKASQAFDNALEKVSVKFNEKVVPILEKSEEVIDVTDIIRKYSDDLSKMASTVTSKTGKPKLVGGSLLDDASTNTLQKFSEDIRRLSSNPTPIELHRTKQKINKILKVKSIRDNPNAKKLLTDINKNIRNKLDSEIPGYKAITDEFRDVFSLQEDIGSKLADDKVEALADQFFNPKKAVQREKIADLMSRSDSAKVALDNLFDERAAKDFLSTLAKDQKFLGFKGFGANIPFTGTSKRKFGEKLAKASERGLRSRGQRTIGAGAAFRGPRELLRKREQ